MAEFILSIGVWGVALTLGAFALGTFINKKTGQALCNPLLLGSIFVIVFLSLLQIPFGEYKESVSFLSYLLLPATVSLAVPLYEQWLPMKQNAKAVICGILAGSVTSMVCIIALSWILKLDPVLSASLMPKSVTSAIGAEVAEELGGIGSLAGALIILTGIVGNLSAAALCRICKLRDPIARGVAIGTGSHAVGTARALQMGRIEGAVSSLSIAVAGVLTAALCPILANFLP
ncbi:MAG: LrgB family protein [Oscillospiraceae bacterium]|nr:LrgB family protein [Oscillospiraceae bacterium]